MFLRLVGIMRDNLASPDFGDSDAPPQRRVLHAIMSMQACLVLKVCYENTQHLCLAASRQLAQLVSGPQCHSMR